MYCAVFKAKFGNKVNGILLYGGQSAATLGDEWELRWDGPGLGERCGPCVNVLHASYFS